MSASPASAMQMQMAWHNGGLFVGMHWIWWTFWLVMLAVLFLAFWRLLADRAQTRSNLFDEERAEDVLRHRFATGEIDEDEYVRMLNVLRETMLGR